MDIIYGILFYAVVYIIFIMAAVIILINKESPIYRYTRPKIVRLMFMILSPILVPAYWFVFLTVLVCMVLVFCVRGLIALGREAME